MRCEDRQGRRVQARCQARRHIRIRKNVSGTAERPRLVVTRSNRNIVAQVIDDLQGHTLRPRRPWTLRSAVAKATRAPRPRPSARSSPSVPSAGVETVVFDRGGNRYAGRIAALADAAREAG
ncbi:50S ribosomal protein L18 [Streptomyces sp. MBRL 10]|nr:50S ribosomal protein L18 [Streptomyces sp. MBRL 10]